MNVQIKNISENERDDFNSIATHPLQAYEWGEFRKKTGVKVIRKGFYFDSTIRSGFQLTIHTIPYFPWTIGYLPKGTMPTPELLSALRKIGKEERCIFIQLEPNVQATDQTEETIRQMGLIPSAHPLFTKYTFQLDISKNEDELLKSMHPKTRYNIRVAQKHSVAIKEESSQEAFQAYLKLTSETTKRQGFYSHTPQYHQVMWETLRDHHSSGLTAHLLVAWYKRQENEKSIPLTTWVVFTFHDTLYYPYGASSSDHRETMSSNLMMWEAIRFGKKSGLKRFDMWGALEEHPDPKNPWFGFHRFKMGYNPLHITFIGSFDLIIYPFAYQAYKLANKLRWIFLKIRQ